MTEEETQAHDSQPREVDRRATSELSLPPPPGETTSLSMVTNCPANHIRLSIDRQMLDQNSSDVLSRMLRNEQTKAGLDDLHINVCFSGLLGQLRRQEAFINFAMAARVLSTAGFGIKNGVGQDEAKIVAIEEGHGRLLRLEEGPSSEEGGGSDTGSPPAECHSSPLTTPTEDFCADGHARELPSSPASCDAQAAVISEAQAPQSPYPTPRTSPSPASPSSHEIAAPHTTILPATPQAFGRCADDNSSEPAFTATCARDFLTNTEAATGPLTAPSEIDCETISHSEPPTSSPVTNVTTPPSSASFEEPQRVSRAPGHQGLLARKVTKRPADNEVSLRRQH